ncbi:NFX1-type zinc finger-containing protein 1, partial [Tolypocladium paradoxum]
AAEDVHRQVRVRARQLGRELGLKGRVDGVPELPPARARGLEALRRGHARGRRGQRGGDVARQRRAEGVEAVDGARDAVEADALEADLAHQLGRLRRAGAGLRGRDVEQDGQRVGRVEGEGGRGLCTSVSTHSQHRTGSRRRREHQTHRNGHPRPRAQPPLRRVPCNGPVHLGHACRRRDGARPGKRRVDERFERRRQLRHVVSATVLVLVVASSAAGAGAAGVGSLWPIARRILVGVVGKPPQAPMTHFTREPASACRSGPRDAPLAGAQLWCTNGVSDEGAGANACIMRKCQSWTAGCVVSESAAARESQGNRVGRGELLLLSRLQDADLHASWQRRSSLHHGAPLIKQNSEHDPSPHPASSPLTSPAGCRSSNPTPPYPPQCPASPPATVRSSIPRTSHPTLIPSAPTVTGRPWRIGNPTEIVLVRMCAFAAKPAAERFAYANALTGLGRAWTEASPPTLWKTLLYHFLAHRIPQEHLYPFAWLAFELVSLPPTAEVDILEDARAIVKEGTLVEAEFHETRELGYRIRHVLQIRDSPSQDPQSQAGAAGGRHDNDHANFRNIQIYPTRDEAFSKLRPYYLTAKEVLDVDLPDRARVHLDNQFRLLREDMLAELREDIQVATGIKKGKRRVFTLGELVPSGINVGETDTQKFRNCSLATQCSRGLESLQNMDVEEMAFWCLDLCAGIGTAFGVLCRGGDIYGFAFIDRNTDLLLGSPPILSLHFTDHHGLKSALLALQTSVNTATQVKFILVDTPVFAYEPVLKWLQGITELPLREDLLNPATAASKHESSSPQLRAVVQKLQLASQDMVPDVLAEIKRAGGTLQVDKAQLDALVSGLTGKGSHIQGPLGTGKSFIGAEIAQCIYSLSNQRILVLSYTNHVLDQFLEHLLEAGIPGESIVRMGSKTKCTVATIPLLLSQQKSRTRLSRDSIATVSSLKFEATETAEDLDEAFNEYQKLSTSWKDISEYLEFSSEDYRFPHSSQFRWRWKRGEDAGVFKEESESEIWNMPSIQERIETYFNQNDVQTLQQKRAIGCTTTGAAKHPHLIRAAKPDVILVEEAGEIMESHILTAMVPTVEQLILIGDHKQLRPKVNNYALSVEKGDGFDLNRSLFERMILQGAPHTDRVVFLNHGKPENTDGAINDRRDPGAKASKKNAFEAEMAIRCLKYLGQQGYSSDQIVILTPYLGQLRTLSDLLRRHQRDPEISELDKFELLRSGLMTQAAAKIERKPVRISTIGESSGSREECDIVIACLTRSNNNGDIGFMAAPERLTVLITRARNCMILKVRPAAEAVKAGDLNGRLCRALTPEECIVLLVQLLGGQKTNLHKRGIELDLAILEKPGAAFKSATLASFSALTAQNSWANARDSSIGTAAGRLCLCEGMVTDELEAMLKERKSRGEPACLLSMLKDLHDTQASAPTDPKSPAENMQHTSMIFETRAEKREPTIDAGLDKEQHDSTEHVDEPDDDSRPAQAVQRDSGVSDAVWEQLQRDRQAEMAREMEHQRLVEASQRARDEARDRIVKRLVDEEARRKREAEMRKKLEVSGLCPMGYQWIRQQSGFRCEGGSHFVSETQLASMRG